MGLKLYCNRYTHFKDALVCSVNCAYRTRCQDFALFYDEHRAEVDALVGDYYAARRERRDDGDSSSLQAASAHRALPLAPVAPAIAQPADLRALIRLEVKREMAEAMYIWVDKEDRAELLEIEEVLRRAEHGAKAKSIYKVAQEMELRFQLVPRKRIEKARRSVAIEAERAASRRSRTNKPSAPSPAPVPFPAPVAANAAANAAPARRPAAPRRTRARVAKAAGDR